MSVKLVLILFVVVVETLCAAAIIWGLWTLGKRFRFQYSLRTLMIGVTLVALVLSSISTWRYLSLARIEWLAPSSTAVRQFWTEPVVSEQGNDFTAVYRAKCRDVNDLYNLALEDQRGHPDGSSGSSLDHQRLVITVESSDKPYLGKMLAALAEADTPKKGWFTIRGIVEDREGRPVADAMVDLMGSYVYINHFQTREDGTFTMLIQAPPDRGYYLRIRYAGNRQMNTARFKLSDDNRELVVRIRVK